MHFHESEYSLKQQNNLTIDNYIDYKIIEKSPTGTGTRQAGKKLFIDVANCLNNTNNKIALNFELIGLLYHFLTNSLVNWLNI